MRRIPIPFLAAGAVALAAWAVEENPADPGPAPQEEKVIAEEQPAALVNRLGDDSFRVRESSTKELWDLGEAALPALEEGAERDDPEVAYRARLLLQRIRTGITPQTPKEIVKLVEEYFRGNVGDKKEIFDTLHEKKAYVQMLRLFRFEKDPAARKACEGLLAKAVLPAILAELVEGRLEEAEKLLRLAPADAANCRRLAALLRVQGRLDEALAESDRHQLFDEENQLIDRPEVADRAAMRLALLRSSGDVLRARELAEKMGRDDLVASLALFEGDPIPYFDWIGGRQDRSQVLRLYASIARKRWEGDEEGAAKLARELSEILRKGGDEQRGALLALLLNGYLEQVQPIIEADHPDSAFNYFETTEQPVKALEALGYAGNEEKKQAWLDKRLESLKNDWKSANSERFDILTLASFLHARGEEEEALRLMGALNKIAQAEGEEDWREFIGRLNDIGGNIYTLAFRLAAERLGAADGDNDARIVISSLFGEGESPRRLWDRLAVTEKETPASDRLLKLGALYGVIHIAPEEIDALLARLHALGKDLDDPTRSELLVDLAGTGEARDDAGYVLACLKELAALQGEETWAPKLGSYYGYVSDWKNTVRMFDAVLKKYPHNPRNLALHAGALIRTGKDERARETLEKVELLGLDESIRLRRLGANLERQGAFPEAERFWRILLMTNAPTDWGWHRSAVFLANHAKRAGKWRVAAAFAEVDAMQSLLGRSTYVNPVIYLRKRFAADLYRGLALLREGEREKAEALFERSFGLLNGDGLLADDYFPLLREAGLVEMHDRHFEMVRKRIADSITAFPKAHNTYNSAAWMASRANRNLDEALSNIQTALEMRPRQAAYLDTMAEVWFARGDREKAVEWSNRAVTQSYHGGHTAQSGVELPGSIELRDQYDRFRSGEFPVK